MVDVQTLKFKAIVLVQSFSTPLVRQPNELDISSSDIFKDVDLTSDNVFFNIVTAPDLIIDLSPPGEIIYALTAVTRMSNLFKITMFLDLVNSITCD
jgi:hypothetical protein